MRVILIDPVARSVTEQDIPANDYKAYYPLLQCDTFDIARSHGAHWTLAMEHEETQIDIYCDDEGLFAPRPLYATQLPTGQTLAGRLVLASSDDMGNTIAAPSWLTLDIVRKAVKFGTMG